MPRPFRLALPLFLLSLCACVPRAQYDALSTERDAYRQEVVAADSAASVRVMAATDSLQIARESNQRQLRQIEDLTAANAALTDRVADLTLRYESILEQNRALVADGGADENLQQRLQDREAELANRQAELESLRRDLAIREQNLTSLGQMRAGQPGSNLTARGTSPVDPQTDAAVRMGKLQDELRQLMLAVADSGYVVAPNPDGGLDITLGGTFAFTEAGDSLNLTGQRIVRRLAATLRNYPGLEYTIVGHAESNGEDGAAAYRRSTERATRIAVRLTESGLDPGTIIAAGRGYYGAEAYPTLSAADAARRTTITVRPQIEN